MLPAFNEDAARVPMLDGLRAALDANGCAGVTAVAAHLVTQAFEV